MAAAVSFQDRDLDPRYTGYPPSRRLRLVEPSRQLHPRPACRSRRAVYRRRRVLAALVGLGLVLTVARAGGALAGSSLATPGRLPHVQQVVVQPGDSLWSIAGRLGAGRDRRSLVDALAAAHGSSELIAGETLTVSVP
jgi:hypothetical protein